MEASVLWYFRIYITPVGQSTTIRFVTTFRVTLTSDQGEVGFGVNHYSRDHLSTNVRFASNADRKFSAWDLSRCANRSGIGSHITRGKLQYPWLQATTKRLV